MVGGKKELIVIVDQPDVDVRQTLVGHRSQPVCHHRQQVGLNEGQLQLYLSSLQHYCGAKYSKFFYVVLW